MNQSRVGVFCLRANILGKCRGEGNEDRLALAKSCAQTLPVFGGVVALKLAKFKPSPKLFFPCLVHTPLCYIRWTYGTDTLIRIKNVCNVSLLVFIVCASKGYIYSVCGL